MSDNCNQNTLFVYFHFYFVQGNYKVQYSYIYSKQTSVGNCSFNVKATINLYQTTMNIEHDFFLMMVVLCNYT